MEHRRQAMRGVSGGCVQVSIFIETQQSRKSSLHRYKNLSTLFGHICTRIRIPILAGHRILLPDETGRRMAVVSAVTFVARFERTYIPQRYVTRWQATCTYTVDNPEQM
jgi:hypothetical protein